MITLQSVFSVVFMGITINVIFQGTISGPRVSAHAVAEINHAVADSCFPALHLSNLAGL